MEHQYYFCQCLYAMDKSRALGPIERLGRFAKHTAKITVFVELVRMGQVDCQEMKTSIKTGAKRGLLPGRPMAASRTLCTLRKNSNCELCRRKLEIL